VAERGTAGLGLSDTPDLGVFDRDTAVRPIVDRPAPGSTVESVYAAEVSPDWRAGRGPHGGYLAAMILRALTDTVAHPQRAPRSLTIHYARAPEPGPVIIRTVIEREGRSLSTLSARMERDGTLIAIALAAFSVPWRAPEISELERPEVDPPDPVRKSGRLHPAAPHFTRHLVLQPRVQARPFAGSDGPMDFTAWVGLAQPRELDALSLAFFSDALLPAVFMRLTEPSVVPTVDLTVHFRASLPRPSDADPAELCLARMSTRVIHEGFFEEDGVIWARDGTVLAQSRQLAIVLPLNTG
jgi:acyl-CoA thioesterase